MLMPVRCARGMASTSSCGGAIVIALTARRVAIDMTENRDITTEANEAKDEFYWTGAENTTKCGCVWRELARTDGSAEPLWIGKSMCAKHLERAGEKAKELGLVPDVE